MITVASMAKLQLLLAGLLLMTITASGASTSKNYLVVLFTVNDNRDHLQISNIPNNSRPFRVAWTPIDGKNLIRNKIYNPTDGSLFFFPL